MIEKQRINVHMSDGMLKEILVVAFLKNDINSKTYVLYTFNDDNVNNPNVDIYVSIFKENVKGYELIPVETDTEWDAICEAISKIESESEIFIGGKDNMHIELASIDGLKEANLKIEQKICEMPKDYINRFDTITATNVSYDNSSNDSVKSALDDIFNDMEIK